MDHAAAHVPQAEELAEPPFLAKAGFLISISGLILAVTVELAPLGYVLALIGIVVSIAGAGHAVQSSRSPRMALTGVVCAGVTIAFWLLARGDMTGYLGGRHDWPSWLF